MCCNTNPLPLIRWGELGFRLWLRARHELDRARDPSLAIVLAAAAVDCELSQIYCKRTRSAFPVELTDETLEKQLRNFRTIKNKIAKIAKLLHPSGIDGFVKSLTWLSDDVTREAPSLRVGSLASDIEQQLFWPRNRILHSAAEYGMEEAKGCLAVGSAALHILREMEFVAEFTALTGKSPI